MPTIQLRQDYDGANERIQRLGLEPLWDELVEVLTGFQLLIEEQRHANGAKAVRHMLDDRFRAAGGWATLKSGGIDWSKCLVVNGTRVCLGVELQVSGRSDLAIVDVAHLRDALILGAIDVGVIVTPTPVLAPYLTDRVASYRDATRAVTRARAEDHPLIVLGIEHDGSGPALAKARTNRGRARPPET